MRILLAISMLSSGILCQAQKIDENTFKRFFENHIQQWNVKIFKDVRSGTMPAYRDGFCKETVDSAELEAIGNHDGTKVVPDENNNYQVLDDFPLKTFDPASDFRGITFRFQTAYGPDGFASGYELFSIGPLHELIVTGIDLGLQPLFWVRANDVKRVLTEDEFTLLRTIAYQQAEISGHRNASAEWEKDFTAQEMGQYLAMDAVRDKYQFTLKLTDTIRHTQCSYAYALISRLVSHLAQNQEEDNTADKLLFRNKALTNTYDRPTYNLGESFITSVPVWDEKSGAESMTDTTLFVINQLSSIYEYNIFPEDGDYVLDLLIPSSDEINHIFVSWNSLKPFLKPNDANLLSLFYSETIRH